MQIDYRLRQDIHRKMDEQRKRPQPGDTDPETMDYAQRKRWKSDINEEQGIFVSSMSKGINTEKSIFDRQATFHMN